MLPESLPIRLSQAQLNTLEACPRLFQHLHLDQLGSPVPPEQQESLTWGSQFHLLMQQQALGLPVEALVDDLSRYEFNTGVAQHLFCQHCGIHAFYRPRSHPDWFDVNVRCLDEDLLERFTIVPFDGKNWEQNVGSLADVPPQVLEQS